MAQHVLENTALPRQVTSTHSLDWTVLSGLTIPIPIQQVCGHTKQHAQGKARSPESCLVNVRTNPTNSEYANNKNLHFKVDARGE